MVIQEDYRATNTHRRRESSLQILGLTVAMAASQADSPAGLTGVCLVWAEASTVLGTDVTLIVLRHDVAPAVGLAVQ